MGGDEDDDRPRRDDADEAVAPKDGADRPDGETRAARKKERTEEAADIEPILALFARLRARQGSER
jgi:hypothetical protein